MQRTGTTKQRSQAGVGVGAAPTGIAMTGIALGELGTRHGSPASAMVGHVLALIGVGFGGLMLLDYPYFFFGFIGFVVLGVVAALRVP